MWPLKQPQLKRKTSPSKPTTEISKRHLFISEESSLKPYQISFLKKTSLIYWPNSSSLSKILRREVFVSLPMIWLKFLTMYVSTESTSNQSRPRTSKESNTSARLKCHSLSVKFRSTNNLKTFRNVKLTLSSKFNHLMLLNLCKLTRSSIILINMCKQISLTLNRSSNVKHWILNLNMHNR